jgi:hypothetical protein
VTEYLANGSAATLNPPTTTVAASLFTCRHRQEIAVSQIRPPALVTEYLASGSLRAAITRRADFLSRDSVRIKLALDAARVSGQAFGASSCVVYCAVRPTVSIYLSTANWPWTLHE